MRIALDYSLDITSNRDLSKDFLDEKFSRFLESEPHEPLSAIQAKKLLSH